MKPVLLLENTYKELSRNYHLNDVIKQIFSEIGSVDQYQHLSESISKIREALMEQQALMVKSAAQ